MAQDAQARGRPRDESIDRDVVTALFDLVKELGLGAVTMDAIAERAGVSKASIYRRWDTKEAMLVDGLASLVSSVVTPTGDDIRAALTEILDQACDFLDSRAGNAFPWLVGEVTAGTPLGSEYAESVVRPRRQIVAAVIRRGVETGQLRPDLDVEVATDLVGGITLTKKLQAKYEEYPDDWVERVVETFLRGWSAE
jgi:AcrR family transcriptional regulator